MVDAAPIIRLEDVRKSFGAVRALQGVDLSCHAGKCIGLVGHNGAGKSTTLAAIAGGVTPHAGSIKLQGRGLVGMPAEAISRFGVSLVPEGRHVFATLTVAQQIFMW